MLVEDYTTTCPQKESCMKKSNSPIWQKNSHSELQADAAEVANPETTKFIHGYVGLPNYKQNTI